MQHKHKKEMVKTTIPSIPILLRGYTIDKCFFEALDSTDESAHGMSVQNLFTITPELLGRPEHLNNTEERIPEYQIRLQITSISDLLSYRIDIELTGFLDVSPRIPKKDRELVAFNNGATLLYSSARDFLLTVTSRGPNPPLMLPTTIFLGTVEQEPQQEDTATPKPKK